jgi:hypothetical protein
MSNLLLNLSLCIVLFTSLATAQFTPGLGCLVSGQRRDLWTFPHVRRRLQPRLPIPHGVVPCIVLKSSRELPNKPDRTSRLLLRRLCPSLPPPIYCFLSITPFSYKSLSLPFIQSCLCLQHFVVYTERDSQFCPLFSVLFILFCSPSLVPNFILSLVVFPSLFTSILKATSQEKLFLSPLSLSCTSHSHLTLFLLLIPMLFPPSVAE